MINKYIIIGTTLILTILFLIIGYVIYKLITYSTSDNFDSLDKFNKKNFIFEIDNVLTPDECDNIINNSKNKLERSKVMAVNKDNEYEDEISTARTSHHTWLKNDDNKSIINKVEKLVNSLLKNKITSKQFEDLQVARYEPTQEYKQHYDICHPTQAAPEHLEVCREEYKKNNCVRYITVILYLNDGFSGGETYFPRLKRKVKPKKGKALIFINCNYNKNTHKDGLCDVINDSEHAGLPVIEDKSKSTNEKWIANIWIRTKNI